MGIKEKKYVMKHLPYIIALLSIIFGFWFVHTVHIQNKVCDTIYVDVYGVAIKVVQEPKLNLAGEFRYNNGTYIINLIVRDVQVMAHEASHASDFILRQRNIKDEEARAYLVGYITQELFNCINN